MKSFTLDFPQRIAVANAIGSTQGLCLADVVALGKVFDEIRVSEEEARNAGMSVDKNGAVSFGLDQDFTPLIKEIHINDEDARRLKKLLEVSSSFNVHARGWLPELIEKL